MEFGDKLQKIRKENNITQEGLADKLGVSRQAVSKWESGQAYPDTEKLIQISKIFHVSLDELINDSKEHNNFKNEKKFDFMETIKIINDFISKSFSMFWAMKFKEKFKCIFEMCTLAFMIFLMAMVSKVFITEIIRRIFMFLPYKILIGICNLVENLLVIAWIVLGFMIIIKIFKTRYLDYYVIIDDDNVKERTIEEPIKELKEKKECKVVIRDPKDSSLNLFNKLWKIILFVIKIFAIFIMLPVTCSFIFLIILEVISLSYLFSGLFFNGISVAILGGLVFISLFILFIFNLLFDRKNNYLKMFILFIMSLSLMGIGMGLSFVSLNSFEIIDDDNYQLKTYNVEYNDNLVFEDIMSFEDDQIVIDNNLSDIKLDVLVDEESDVDIYTYNIYDERESYKIIRISYIYDDINLYKRVIEDLKEKKIKKYNGSYELDKIYLSSDHLTKLKENNNKFYN